MEDGGDEEIVKKREAKSPGQQDSLLEGMGYTIKGFSFWVGAAIRDGERACLKSKPRV